jgi:hypothetical protein
VPGLPDRLHRAGDPVTARPAGHLELYCGTHEPSWLARASFPLFVSHRRFAHRAARGCRTLPRARVPWALDSGGFTELSMHGAWQITPRDYCAAVARYDREIGGMEWAAPQDWMCEPAIRARTGLTVADHQARTVANYLQLAALWPEFSDASLPFMPVLQGWHVDDYLRCVDRYHAAGVDLREAPVVGLGSVCRRQATGEIGEIAFALQPLRLHGFGVKTSGLRLYGYLLASADSMAWSARGRRLEGCGPSHSSEANCLPWAEAWRAGVLAAAGEPLSYTRIPEPLDTRPRREKGRAPRGLVEGQTDLVALLDSADAA